MQKIMSNASLLSVYANRSNKKIFKRKPTLFSAGISCKFIQESWQLELEEISVLFYNTNVSFCLKKFWYISILKAQN